MSVERRSAVFQFIGLLGVVAIGAYAWFLYDDFQATTEKRVAQNQHVQQYIDDIELYKKMLSIQKNVDAMCLSDGPQAKGLVPTDAAYNHAQEDYEICFMHVFFKPSFQLPFYEDDLRENFNFKMRTQVFWKEMATYRRKFENIEEAQNLLAASVDKVEPEDKFILFPDEVLELAELSDIEIYKMMRKMQQRMEASCKQQKEFHPGGEPKAKMDPEQEKIWDEHCYDAAVYYHQTLLPYPWWKGLGVTDLSTHFFRARFEAYQARFPEIKD